MRAERLELTLDAIVHKDMSIPSLSEHVALDSALCEKSIRVANLN